MFSFIYENRVIDVEYCTPFIGMKWRGYTIVDINYYSKVVWLA